MNNEIAKTFEGQEIKVKTNKGFTLINLACTAKVCGLTKSKNGNCYVRWTDKGVAEKLELISSTDVEPVYEAEINSILDEIESIDNRNTIYMSSWLSKRLALECHSDKAMKYKNFLVTLDEEYQSGKLFQEKYDVNQFSPELQAFSQIVNLMKQHEMSIKEIGKKAELANTRIDNLDCTNIQGTPQQRLNAMIRKYSYENGIIYSHGWEDFRKAYNTAYHTNVVTKCHNYCEDHHIKKLSIPAYLTRVGLIEDALRVADKMLNSKDIEEVI